MASNTFKISTELEPKEGGLMVRLNKLAQTAFHKMFNKSVT